MVGHGATTEGELGTVPMEKQAEVVSHDNCEPYYEYKMFYVLKSKVWLIYETVILVDRLL
jgi:hypothetical protein